MQAAALLNYGARERGAPNTYTAEVLRIYFDLTIDKNSIED